MVSDFFFSIVNPVENPDEIILETIPFLITLFSYGIATFCCFLFLQPTYYRIVRKLKIQQEIREHTSDGRIAEIFRAFHLKNQEPYRRRSPHLGISSHCYFALTLFLPCWILDKSLLQQGEVYLPLFSLIVMEFWRNR